MSSIVRSASLVTAGFLVCVCTSPAQAGGPNDVTGRCCFVGIVPEPILCEVNTLAECQGYAGFISWTPNLTCDTPCDNAHTIFAGCGTLGPGPQGCVLFTADSGEVFALENLGPTLPSTPHVWVRGIVNPQSHLCLPFVMPGLMNNTIAPCFEGCGTLVLGVECVLFAADSGGLFLLSNLGGFQVGDRVFVRGGLNPLCYSFCMQGNGCIDDNEIAPCGDPTQGACCFTTNVPTPTPPCIVTTEDKCAAQNGTYLGNGTFCSPNSNPCPLPGRCCFFADDANILLCDVNTQAECEAIPTYVSWTPLLTCDTPCSDVPPTGACCSSIFGNPLGCLVLTPEQCLQAQGTYIGDNTTCTPVNPCSGTLGRCCFLGIVPEPILCEVTTQVECFQHSSPISWTAGLTCDTPCDGTPAQGACCVPVPGSTQRLCIVTTQADCLAQNGQYLGDITICNSFFCPTPLTGACCIVNPNGTITCMNTTELQCQQAGGAFQGLGTNCQTTTCGTPATGACCYIDPIGGPTLCIETTAAECEASGGLYSGDGTTCLDDGCPPIIGACCTDVTDGPLQYETCTVTSAFDCQLLGGVFQGLGTQCILTACCLPDGICVDADPRCCIASGGVPHNAPCDAADCSNPPIGACCLSPAGGTLQCVEVTAAQCDELGGLYLGNGTHCVNNFCPVVGDGACCLDIDDGPLAYDTCIVTSADDCVAQGGVFQGTQTQCQPTACCLPGGFCQEADPECCMASGGVPQNAPCSATDCTAPGQGACCLLTNVPGAPNCIVTTAEQCAAFNGDYQGDGTNCNSVDVCPVLGRCCFLGINPNEPICEVLTQEECLNQTVPISWTAFLTCDTPCTDVPHGACCVPVPGSPNPQCVILTQLECQNAGGSYLGDNTLCAATSCPPPVTGACCLNSPIGPAICIVTTQAHCASIGGTYQGNGTTCQNVSCFPPPPTGACCVPLFGTNGFTCVVTTATQCAAQGGTYQGDNTSCNTVTCGPTVNGACCLDIDDGPLAYDTCIITTAANCQAQGGSFSGPGTPCILTACCIGDYCQETSPQCCLASGGVPKNTGCDVADVCQAPPTGACCRNILTPTGATLCSVVTQAQCEALGGLYRGDGTGCPWACSNAFFAGCGTLAPGPQGCTVLQTNFGLVLALGNTGDFSVGDYVFVAGVINPLSMLCFPVQMPAIENNVIGPCEPGFEPACARPGDLNGDGHVNGLDVPEFVSAVLGSGGANAMCASYGTGTLEGDIAAFVTDLTAQ